MGSADGNFTLATPQVFASATRGGCSIVDFNNDGLPDISYTGSTDYSSNDSRIFKVYLNNGNMNFTDANITLPGITGLVNSSLSWADGDADGDQDLLINGHDGNTNVARMFTRNGNSFTNSTLSLRATSAGSLSWVDVNMDGRPDIVNTGIATPDHINGIVPELLINNGGNNFSLTPTNLPARAFVSSDWTDYDGDNDMDLVLSGRPVGMGPGTDAAVFKNNGSGQFARVSNLDGINKATKIKWNDFNNDGKLDVICGGYFIKNMGADSFKIASFLTTSQNNFPQSTIIEDLNNDGLVDIFIAGENFLDVDCNFRSNSTLVLGRDWRLSALPKFTEVADVNTLNPVIPGSNTELYFRWGDFDNDGKQDILMSGDHYSVSSNRFLVVYKNNGNNNFSLYFNSLATPLPPVPYTSSPGMGYAGLFDIDNDGINEIFTIPNLVHKYIGGQWTISSYIAPSTSYSDGARYMDFSDFDGDGFTDVVVSGPSNAAVFKNDGAGNMVNISQLLPSHSGGVLSNGGSERQIQWVDFDDDGDPDILTSKGLYENINDSFNFLVNPILPFVHASMGDINNDGFKDLVTVPRTSSNGPMELHYSAQGTGFFIQHSLGTLKNALYNVAFNNAVEVFDIDNDGDNDIVYSGGGNCGGSAQVTVNERNFTDRLIHVISPNGGEAFFAGNTTTIKWYGNKIGGTVKIELSLDSGITWQLLTASAPSSASGGSYTWNVPNTVSKKCLVKITDNTNSIFSDKSNWLFEISVPVLPVANAGIDTLICDGGTAHIGSPAIGNNSYSWSSSDGMLNSSLSQLTVAPTVNTSYFLTVSNGTLTARDTVYVLVSTINVLLPDTVVNTCIGNEYSIGAPAQPGVTYEWQSIPAGFTSTQSNPTISAINTGVIYYYVLATDVTSGCTATAYVDVIVDSCITAGNMVNIYPNPANNQVNIQLSPNTQLPLYLRLVNGSGVLVFSQTLTATNTLINLSGYQSGSYYYKVSTPDGQQLQSGILLIIH